MLKRFKKRQSCFEREDEGYSERIAEFFSEEEYLELIKGNAHPPTNPCDDVKKTKKPETEK